MSYRLNWGYTDIDKIDETLKKDKKKWKKYLQDELGEDEKAKKMINQFLETETWDPKDDEEYVLLASCLIAVIMHNSMSKDVMTDLVWDDLVRVYEFTDKHFTEEKGVDWLYNLFYGMEIGKYGSEIMPPENPVTLISKENVSDFLKSLQTLKEKIVDSELAEKFTENEYNMSLIDELIKLLKNVEKQKKFQDIYIWLG